MWGISNLIVSVKFLCIVQILSLSILLIQFTDIFGSFAFFSEIRWSKTSHDSWCYQPTLFLTTMVKQYHFQKWYCSLEDTKNCCSKPQGCIFRLTCSHCELTKDLVLTSAYVKFFNISTCEHKILGQLMMGEGQTKNAPLVVSSKLRLNY